VSKDEVVQTTTPVVSEADDSLDRLVEMGSIPDLSSLVRKGKEQGLIKAQQNYVST
jgi:hypothetical protein